MKTFVMTFALVVGFAVAPAFAFQCPADMASIDEALSTADLSESDRARVMELREQGEAEHAAGNHEASMELLAEAKGLLGVE